MTANIHVCHRCPERQQVCAGACPCLVDGRDISDHAEAGDCPRGYYSEPERLPPRAAPQPAGPAPLDIPLAGDVVEKIIKAVGADRLAKFWERKTGKPCNCAERKVKLNRASERLLNWWAKWAG